MNRNPNLPRAEEVFTELGWADADLDHVLDLPLGTAAQRKTALAGLRTGDWSGYLPEDDPLVDRSGQLMSYIEYVTTSDSRTTTRRDLYETSFLKVDHGRLVLFAIRMGVSAARAVALLQERWSLDIAVTAAVLGERDIRFAESFVARSRSDLPHYTIYLVHRHQLKVPRSPAFLERWARIVEYSMASPLPVPTVADRFGEYVRTAVELGVLGPPVARVAALAVTQGWWDRDDAVAVTLQALDVATRSSERTAWLSTLVDHLGFTEAEIVAHADAFVPLLATDSSAVDTLAPALLAGVNDEQLVDVATVGLTARTKKARRTVLLGLVSRPRPTDDSVAALVDLVAEVGTDRTLAALARSLLTVWQAKVEAPVTELVGDCWQPTPPVWQVPRFVRGESTIGAVADLAAELLARQGIVDVSVERFLAMATDLACTDPDALRTAVAAVGAAWNEGLFAVHLWRDGPPPWWNGASGPQPGVREAQVGIRLGEMPCLVSEPSWDDLRVDPADLTARLGVYGAAGAAVAEADLQLALTRLDLDLVDAAMRTRWAELAVPVVDGEGHVLSFTAGPTILAYVDDPFVEPVVRVQTGQWRAQPVVPTSFARFARPGADPTARFVAEQLTAVFPTWQVVGRIRAVGPQWHQVVRHSRPLSPAVAVNLLAAAGTPDGAVAVRDAWDRGLLPPGAADVRYLGWTEIPTGIAAFATTLGDLARDGLASVVWPVLDDLLVASLRAPNPLAGTVTVVETIAALLPEIRHAVDTGVALASALDLPGTRALAARAGTSGAVRVATQVVADLPAPTTGPVRVERPTVEVIWPDHGPGEPLLDDARLTWHRTNWGALVIDIDVPGDRVYRFERQVGVGGCSVIDLRSRTRRHRPAPDAQGDQAEPNTAFWLAWDGDARRLVTLPRSQVPVVWQDGTHWRWDIPNPPPMSSSLVTIALADLCPATTEWRPDGLLAVCASGVFGPAELQVASRTVLDQGLVEPSALIRVVERHPEALARIWPLLTEPIRLAGTIDGPLPRWVTRALDVALLHAETLRPAVEGRLLGDASTFPGLRELAARPGKNAAPTRSRELLTTWGLHE